MVWKKSFLLKKTRFLFVLHHQPQPSAHAGGNHLAYAATPCLCSHLAYAATGGNHLAYAATQGTGGNHLAYAATQGTWDLWWWHKFSTSDSVALLLAIDLLS